MSCNSSKYLENEEEFDLKIEYREYEKNHAMNWSIVNYFYFYLKMNFSSKSWFMASLAPKNVQVRKAQYLIKNFGELLKTKFKISFLL